MPLDAERVMVQGNDEAMKRQALLGEAQLRGVKVVILGDVPATVFAPEQVARLADWVNRGGALMVMAGPQNLGPEGIAGTALNGALPVVAGAPGSPAPYVEREFKVTLTPDGAAHPAFQRVEGTWAGAAPLLSRFEVRGVKPASTVLMATTGGAPLVVSRRAGNGKVAIVLTDSTWRWQLGFDPATATIGGATPHRALWDQMVDWLLPDLDAGGQTEGVVQVISDRVAYEVNDRVSLRVSVRSADGQPVSDAQVTLDITAPQGPPIERTATFVPDADAAAADYAADFPTLAAGEYVVRAVAARDSTPLGTDQTRVTVTQPLTEFLETDPDPAALRAIAEATGGKVLAEHDLEHIDWLVDLAPRQITVQPRADDDAEPVWNRWWIAALLITLLSGEWIIRRLNRWV